jgi:hypothetical protein
MTNHGSSKKGPVGKALALCLCGLFTQARVALASGDAREEVIDSRLMSDLAARHFEQKPFDPGVVPKEDRYTLGKFFGSAEYKRLRGNPVLGWLSIQDGFEMPKGVRLTRLESANGCEKLSQEAWELALDIAAKHRGMKRPARSKDANADSSAQLELGCIEAFLAPTTKSDPGVLIEARLIDGNGHELLYRAAIGKPRIGDALVAAADLILGLGIGAGK